MFQHKLDYDRLKNDFEKSFEKNEKKALDDSLLFNSNFIDNLIYLLKEEISVIDRYYYDFSLFLGNKDITGHEIYDFYHRYFSNDIANEEKEKINEGNSNVEIAYIYYVEDGYKIVPETEASEDVKNNICDDWGDNCSLLILINKKIMEQKHGLTLSLVELSTLPYYRSKEEYIGELLKYDLNDDILSYNNEETKRYFVEVIKEYSNKNGNNLNDLLEDVMINDKPIKYSLERH
ncbi:MAG: hypothetical protein GX032_00940 [Tenericutes bacterium]|nr:hypothetical protein [Bacilli bacterium]MDD3995587.1 hypothetical protein [Bacilli bacterium]NLV90027.1 hypothetical protein [Mycoplasmatota bacterium]